PAPRDGRRVRPRTRVTMRRVGPWPWWLAVRRICPVRRVPRGGRAGRCAGGGWVGLPRRVGARPALAGWWAARRARGGQGGGWAHGPGGWPCGGYAPYGGGPAAGG